MDTINLKTLEIPPEIIGRVSAKFASFYKVLPIDYQGGLLTIACVDPTHIETLDGVVMAARVQVKALAAPEKDIVEAIRKYYGIGAETIDRMMDSTVKKETPAIQTIDEIGSEASIAKFIQQILSEAYRDRATDIHVEPYEKELKIRYRIDGLLYDTQLPANIWHFKDAINSRIKILSNLNIAEKRLPQDGRFKAKVDDLELDLRVSFLPTQYGESVVIRILSSSKLYDLHQLGLNETHLRILAELIKKPHGLVFLTGQTGSGKTTTLYSCLSQVNSEDRKIITIEDPIEYQLKGVTQIQVNPSIGLTFAAGLRSMLRHDPDIMMVGEVRDLETAQIAIQVALTGHLVFSTLHTNDAASGATRLMDMGIEPYLIASSVECFIAQRLVRRVCSHCKTPTKMTAEMIKDLGLEKADFLVYEAKGCEACRFTGYHGREAIYEFLLLTDEIRELIAARASAGQIYSEAVNLGMKTLLQDGLNKVREGKTTPSEVIRVIKEGTV
jgi:type II secretory ATPase GspE/PulE/Tfp pilus assembly ATPase PilB-like protein